MFGVLFRDPHLALDAVYTPPGGGAGVACRAIFDERDRDAEFGVAGAVQASPCAQVRAAELAAPAEDGTLTIAFAAGPRAFKIKGAVYADSQRALWKLALRAV